MKIYELDKENTPKSYIDRIARLHMKAFPDFFLTQLGRGFLRTLYQGYLEDENSGIIAAEDEKGRLLGFIAYSKDYSNFYKGLIKHHILEFATGAASAALRHPSFTKRLLGAFKKSDEVVKTEKYVELASIGVNPNVEGKGVGSKLIDYLKDHTDFNRFAYISLETDAENNDAANAFYKKNGFVLSGEYTTPEGRKMNEYHYSGQIKQMEKKKIAIITLAVALEDEKGYSRFRSLAEILSKKFDVDIITSTFQHWEKKQRDINSIESKSYPYHILFAYEPGYKKNVDVRRITSHKVAVKNILRILGENQYDLIYCIIPPNNMAAKVGEFAHNHNIKYIVDVEDLWPEAMEMVSPLPKSFNKLLFRGFREDARKAYEFADAFVGTSDEYRDVPKNKYAIIGKPSETVYVGCDLDDFDAGVAEFSDSIEKPEGEFWITYAGNLGSSYDIGTLIKAAQILYKNGNRDIRVKILGGGPLEDDFKAIAQEKPCNVDFVGYTPYREMAAWLSLSDILINSFVKKAPQSIVTKIGDYLAAGKPMINTLSSPEFRKKVEDDGFGMNVEAEDPEKLVNLILAMSEDRKKLHAMSESARKVAEIEFDRKNSYKKIIKLINILLQNN